MLGGDTYEIRRTKDGYVADLGAQSLQTEAPREVTDAQAQPGVAFADERCMEVLRTSRGKAIPEGYEADADWKTEFAMGFIAAIMPAIAGTQAAAWSSLFSL